MKKQPETREAIILKMVKEKVFTRNFEPITGTLKNLTTAGEDGFSKIAVETKKSAASLPLKGNKKRLEVLTAIKKKTERVFAVFERDLPDEKITEHLNETITVSKDSIIFHN